MLKIIPATKDHLSALVNLGRQTFLESHGNSAAPADIQDYLDSHYTRQALSKELEAIHSHYDICFWMDEPVGFSKITFDQPIIVASYGDDIDQHGFKTGNYAKLDRIYILAEHHGKKMAQAMFERQRNTAIKHQQKGIWLYVWVENKRAIAFYEKMGFQKIGKYDFQISEKHSNPNWVMALIL